MTTPARRPSVAAVTRLPDRPVAGPPPLDLAQLDDARVLAVGRVPAGSRVLDVGTGDGAVPAALRRTGCRVRAVEVDPVVAELARRGCEQVVVADVETLDLGAAFGAASADVVLALDVLGWLRDPAPVLARAAREVLDPNGWMVLSLPNVAHASVRLRLLAGRPGAPGGRPVPLRLFDARGKDDLLAAAGLVEIGLERVARPLDRADAELAAGDEQLLERLVGQPDALTAEYVVTAVPAGSPLVDDPPVLPAAAAQAVALRALSRAEGLAGRLAELEPMAAGAGALLPRLEAMRTASLERRKTLRSLLVMLEENLTRMREG